MVQEATRRWTGAAGRSKGTFTVRVAGFSGGLPVKKKHYLNHDVVSDLDHKDTEIEARVREIKVIRYRVIVMDQTSKVETKKHKQLKSMVLDGERYYEKIPRSMVEEKPTGV